MMNRKIFIAKTETELEHCYHIMKELRPHLSFDEYISIYQQAHTADGYEIAAIEEQEKILAVMGYRFLSDYVRGKHLYIDDLISTETARSRGLGAELLQFAEQIAKKHQCKVIRLCTGVENERGIVFYERNGWTKRAYAYTKKL